MGVSRDWGGNGGVQRGMRFALWAMARRRAFDVHDVMNAFDVSRATAHRLMTRWRDVSGCGVAMVGKSWNNVHRVGCLPIEKESRA